jgi:hypothetical protein
MMYGILTPLFIPFFSQYEPKKDLLYKGEETMFYLLFAVAMGGLCLIVYGVVEEFKKIIKKGS